MTSHRQDDACAVLLTDQTFCTAGEYSHHAPMRRALLLPRACPHRPDCYPPPESAPQESKPIGQKRAGFLQAPGGGGGSRDRSPRQAERRWSGGGGGVALGYPNI